MQTEHTVKYKTICMSSVLSDSFCFHSFNGIIMNFNRVSFFSCRFTQQPTKIKLLQPSIEKPLLTRLYQFPANTHTYTQSLLFSLSFGNKIFFPNLWFILHFFFCLHRHFCQRLLNQLAFLKADLLHKN